MTSASELNRQLQDLWKQMLPLMLSRVEAIREAQRALASGKLSEELRESAIQEAHKLAGSLGSFGMKEGSQAAARIEQALAAGVSRDSNEASQLNHNVEYLYRTIKINEKFDEKSKPLFRGRFD